MKEKELVKKSSSPSGRLGGDWRNSYTWVLIANAAYIVIFYFIMKIFA